MSRRVLPHDALIDQDPEPDDRQFVTALARGLKLLRAFAPGDGPLGNSELVQRTGLPKPTVSRLAYTLTRLGYLRHSPELNKYALGSATISLGYAALGQLDVRRVARPLLQHLCEQTRTTVHLAVNDRLSMQVVDSYWNAAAFVIDIGSRLPVATTSLGRAYVCALPPEQRRGLLDAIRAARPDEWSANKKRFEQAFSDYEEHGFCFGIGDWRREVNAVAVPLVPEDGSDPVVIGCSGPAFQLEPDHLTRDVGPRLLALVGNLRSSLHAE